MSFVLAFASALLVGGADFLMGLGARIDPPARIPIAANVTSFAVLALLSVWATPTEVTMGALAVGAASGIAGALGFTVFLTALETGKMSIVSPVAAIVGGVALVGFAIIDGERPSIANWCGIILAIAAAGIVSITPDAANTDGTSASHRPLLLAVAAGAIFAVFFWLLSQIPTEAALTPLLTARVASISVQLVIATAMTGSVLVSRETLMRSVPGGALEAVAIVFAMIALQQGPLAINGVLTGLYPLSTVMLAWLVLHERLSPQQWVGVGCALVALPLLGWQ